jgi:hypothetical protein
MKLKRVVAPSGGRALLVALTVTGCTGEIYPGPGPDDGMETVSGTDDGEAGDTADDGAAEDGAADDGAGDEATGRCALGAPGVYTPFAASGAYPSGPVDELAWSGASATRDALAYPAGDEDFSGYGPTLPDLVECSDEKDRRSHVDVTAGCLDAVDIGSYTRGLIRTNEDDLFRAVALGYRPGDMAHPIKWTDQGVEYRFFHDGRSGSTGYPGFKAFARYRSEDDLYVASWRFDGVVQIQRKLCGEYTWLAVIDDYGPPSAGVWHEMRFEAVGDELRLYLDGDLALSATSDGLSWGTAGIRIDSADGSYIDDWSIFQP